MRKKIIIDLLIIVCAVFIITLPFIDQAFHIDDEGALSLAKSMKGISLLDVFKQKHSVLGHESNYLKSTHPLLTPMILRAMVILTGKYNEQLFHILFIIFPLLASISAYFIAKQFTEYPLWAALFLIVTPAFTVMSHTIMNDIPAMAFFLSSMAAYIYGFERRNLMLLVLSGILAGFSVFCSYHMLYIIPFMLLYSLLNKKEIIRSSIAMVIPLFIFLLISFLEYLSYGIPQILMAFKDVYTGFKFNIVDNILRNGLSTLSYLGGAVLFPLFLVFIFFKKKYTGVYFVLLVISIDLLFLSKMNFDLLNSALFIVLIFSGVLIVYKLLENGIRNISRPCIFLFLWFSSVLFINAAILPFNAVRHILPLLLPCIIIIINLIAESVDMRYIKHLFITGMILTSLLSLSLSLADYEFAGLYRRFARQFSGTKPKNRVWFSGEWGFRWYMEDEGYSYLLADDRRPVKGDIIVIPELPCPMPLPGLRSRMKLIDTVEMNGNMAVRIIDPKVNAGFYSDGFGFLPYGFSGEKLESFKIFKMR